MFNNFKNEWLGRRVDYDHVFFYQCVDLILQACKEIAGVASGIWGNAIDYAYHPTAAFLAVVDKVTDGSKQPGDILVFTGLAGNPYGHIALRDTDVNKLLEQNGATGGGSGTGNDAIGVYRAIPTSRLVATYRFKALEGGQPTNTGGTATVLHQCYVRTQPNTASALGGSQVLEAGDTFQYSAKVAGQNISGNNIWYHSTRGNYVWSGNCKG